MARPRKPISRKRKRKRVAGSRRKASQNEARRKRTPPKKQARSKKAVPVNKAKHRGAPKSKRPKSKAGGKRKFARRVLIYTDGAERAVKVASPKMASLVGEYMSAVSWLITHNDPARLSEFSDTYVTDAKRKRYLLETRPNALYRLSQAGGPSFENIYRVVAR